MKTIIYNIFFTLIPCLAWAQYPSNGNQKITLGEQTTADGLIWRGVLADTGNITPSSDTSAYIILDTVNHRFYNYNRTTNVWSVAGGGTAVTTFSGGSTGLTPSTATSGAVTLGGTLSVANGGTGLTTFTASNRIPYTSSATALTTSSNLTYNNNTLTIGNENTNYDNLALKNKATTLNTARRVGITANTFENDSLIGLMSVYADASQRSIVFGGGVSNLKNPTDINFFTSPNVENPADRGARLRMFINDIGDIGMGTSTPSQKLHVVGNGLFTGNLGVGGATPTTSGNGITFPATQSASTNANTLDDYEEGTWTPTFTNITNCDSSTYTDANYVKIGGFVYYSIRGTVKIITANSKVGFVFSTPFSQSNTSDNQGGSGIIEGPNPFPYAVVGLVDNSTSNSSVFVAGPASAITFNGNSYFYFTGFYKAN